MSISVGNARNNLQQRKRNQITPFTTTDSIPRLIRPEENPSRQNDFVAGGDSKRDDESKKLSSDQRVKEWMKEKSEKEKKLKQEQKNLAEKAKREAELLKNTKEQIRKNTIENWLAQKNRIQQVERDKRKKEKEEAEKLIADRKKVSEVKVKEWMKKSWTRGPPVSQKMGSGIPHGTFINPVPWQNAVEE